MLDLAIPDLATAHGSFLTALRGTGEDALLDFARETLPDLVKAVGPETEEQGKSIVTGDILKVVRPIRLAAVARDRARRSLETGQERKREDGQRVFAGTARGGGEGAFGSRGSGDGEVRRGGHG